MFGTLKILKKLLDGETKRILFVDESMIRDSSKHRGVKLVGYLNYETGEIYCEEHETYDAKVFLLFLENLLSKNTKSKTIVILDNARIHHAKLLQPFLKENQDRM